MSNIDLHEFNVLSKRHNYFMTNNRVNGFPTLKNSSIFLQKILSNKESNSIDKKKSKINIEQNIDNNLKNYFNMRTYQSPQVIYNTEVGEINSSNNNNNKYIIQRIINRKKNMVISPDRNINYNLIHTNKINTPSSSYYKIPINMTQRMAKSPDLIRNYDINNDYYSEHRVLNYNGKKIFTTESFNGLRSNTKTNSPERNEDSQKESELFRNYEELKKKKDEIYKRKIKRDSSLYRKQILKIQKDKEIKQQSINKDKLKIIHFKNSFQKFIGLNSNDNIKNPKNKIYKLNHNKSNKTLNPKNNIIILQKSKNLYDKKNFKTNNIYISKNITTNKSKTNIGTPEKFSRPNNNINENNNQNNLEQIFYTNDGKIIIKIHTLKDKNMIFIKNSKKRIDNLKMQKINNINYYYNKKKSFNKENIKNKKLVKRIKNLDILCSIKEEEEKSKSEQIIKDIYEKNDIKTEINDNINIIKEKDMKKIGGGVRNRYLSRLRKK